MGPGAPRLGVQLVLHAFDAVGVDLERLKAASSRAASPGLPSFRSVEATVAVGRLARLGGDGLREALRGPGIIILLGQDQTELVARWGAARLELERAQELVAGRIEIGVTVEKVCERVVRLGRSPARTRPALRKCSPASAASPLSSSACAAWVWNWAFRGSSFRAARKLWMA